jgi:hypothetical protein
MSVAFFISVMALIFGFYLSKGHSVKRKLITWGIVFMAGLAPFFSFFCGIAFGIRVGDGFAGGAVMIMLFVLFFLIGLILTAVGIFKKRKPPLNSHT